MYPSENGLALSARSFTTLPCPSTVATIPQHASQMRQNVTRSSIPRPLSRARILPGTASGRRGRPPPDRVVDPPEHLVGPAVDVVVGEVQRPPVEQVVGL